VKSGSDNNTFAKPVRSACRFTLIISLLAKVLDKGDFTMQLQGENAAPVRNPPIIKQVLNDTRLAWLWLPLRLYLGWQWIQAGLHKLSDPKWMQSGEALREFWGKAVQVNPKPVIEIGWYRDFIQSMLDSGAYVWFAKVVTFGELAVGVLLILGIFTGLAAFLGAFMNWNYVMAGSASVNGLLLAIAGLLILTWKTAGWIGLDRWLLPWVCAPWSKGRFARLQPPSTARKPGQVLHTVKREM